MSPVIDGVIEVTPVGRVPVKGLWVTVTPPVLAARFSATPRAVTAPVELRYSARMVLVLVMLDRLPAASDTAVGVPVVPPA